jgi:protoporphyrinogen oxidase
MSIESRQNESKKKAIIIGAGPAGLTAAYELVTKTDIIPIIIEASNVVGGLSKTITIDSWSFDIGPHRFFSKDQAVNDIWEAILPLQGKPSQEDLELNRKIDLSSKENAPDPEESDRVMLSKNRLTRIYHRRRFFDYPIKINFKNLQKMGLIHVAKILFDYLKIKIKPVKPEQNLEDFFINRFGKTLYQTFFKDYTEKVWGVSCRKIPKSWGAQRVKNLSITKIIVELIKKTINPNRKTKETSLIDRFIYPKLGAGQMYEEMAKEIISKGGIIKTGHIAQSIKLQNKSIKSVLIKDKASDTILEYEGDYFFSSLAIKDLIKITDDVPEKIRDLANDLQYRDLILIVSVYDKLLLKNDTKIKTRNNLVPDNWIYVQEKEAKMGRLDIFNNFSPWMLKNQNQVLIAAEYFCAQNDAFWKQSDEELTKYGKQEFSLLGIASEGDWKQSFIHRQLKAYPAYLGSYQYFDQIKDYLNSIDNLFSIGRNGQHRYNNMDHSMLTAIKAVEAIRTGNKDKEAIWNVNTETTYHEKK